MAGIVFLRTSELDRIKQFYLERVGMSVRLEQPDICILRHDNLLVGFHAQPQADLSALLTFFKDDRRYVDRMYEKLKDIAIGPPQESPRYRIYHFYAQDPEGRRIEFQTFLHPIPSL